MKDVKVVKGGKGETLLLLFPCNAIFRSLAIFHYFCLIHRLPRDVRTRSVLADSDAANLHASSFVVATDISRSQAHRFELLFSPSSFDALSLPTVYSYFFLSSSDNGVWAKQQTLKS